MSQLLVATARVVARAVVATCVVALAVHWLVGGQDRIVEGQRSAPAVKAPYVPPALAAHADECWQGGEAPLAPLPGAAVVQYLDGRVVYTTRHDLVDAAFAEVLGERTSDRIDTVALCL